MSIRHGPSSRKNRAEVSAGFTLMELMVVVAVIGILTAMTAVRVSKTRYAKTVRDYAEVIAGACDLARQRAVATRRWQRLEITADSVTHWQAETEGMGEPETWSLVRRVSTPAHVEVVSANTRSHIAPDDDVPEPGAGIPADIDFAPDGKGTAATVFVGDDHDRDRARVVLFRATGTAYVMDLW